MIDGKYIFPHEIVFQKTLKEYNKEPIRKIIEHINGLSLYDITKGLIREHPEWQVEPVIPHKTFRTGTYG